jgi:hypothetical protein
MGPCGQVKKWIEENIQIPAERFVTQFREACEEYKRLIEEQLQQPVERWVSELRQTCVEQSCNWWCLCCNKWLCWAFWVVVKVVTWIVVTIVKWVVYLVCKVVAFIVKVVVQIFMTVWKWLVVFVVCLFTDPVAAIKSIRDLWSGILDIYETVVEFGKELLEDLGELLGEYGALWESLLSAIPLIGPLLAGLVRWGVEWVRSFIELFRGLFSDIADVVFGVFRLNLCRIVAGGAGIGIDVLHVISLVFRIPGGAVGGVRDSYDENAVRAVVEAALQESFGEDLEGLRLARRKIRINQRPFGLPLTLDVRRFFISSRSDSIDLRELHDRGLLNLSAASNLATDCSQTNEAGERQTFVLNNPRWEVVYAGTETPVDYRTIRLFLEQGPDAVPEFQVFAIRRDVLRRSLDVTKRKGFQLGVDFSWTIGIYEITRLDEVRVPDTQAGNDALMRRVGRTGRGDDLCRIPSLAISDT